VKTSHHPGSLAFLVALTAAPIIAAAEPTRPFRAQHVFDLERPILFHDDFSTQQFRRWNFSEDDRYRLLEATPERICIVDAPGLERGQKAARFFVPRRPNSFRAEISLPSEKGFLERWYGGRVLVPQDWVVDPGRGNDIVMQWHAIPGDGKATYPNLAISIGNTSWFIARSCGSAKTKPNRTRIQLEDPVKPGTWVSWVVHAKWSPETDGVLQIWKDRRLVVDIKGPNVYGDIGLAYTPYLKTGIYHPEWHLDTNAKREAFEKEIPAATTKVIYITDCKVGDARATFGDVSPNP
jgi:hypothetical protein